MFNYLICYHTLYDYTSLSIFTENCHFLILSHSLPSPSFSLTLCRLPLSLSLSAVPLFLSLTLCRPLSISLPSLTLCRPPLSLSHSVALSLSHTLCRPPFSFSPLSLTLCRPLFSLSHSLPSPSFSLSLFVVPLFLSLHSLLLSAVPLFLSLLIYLCVSALVPDQFLLLSFLSKYKSYNNVVSMCVGHTFLRVLSYSMKYRVTEICEFLVLPLDYSHFSPYLYLHNLYIYMYIYS